LLESRAANIISGVLKRPLLGGIASITVSHFLIETFVENLSSVLIPVFMREYKLDWLAVGIVVVIPQACKALGTIPCMTLSEKVKHNHLTFLSLALSSVAAISMIIAQDIYLAVLLLSLMHFSLALYHPPSYSMVSELSGAQRTKAMGMLGAAGTLGWASGLISFGLLTSILNWRFVYVLWGIPTLLGAFPILQLKTAPPRREDEPGHSRAGSIIGNIRKVLTITFALFIFTRGLSLVATKAVSMFLPSYLNMTKGMTIQVASLVLGIMPLIGVASEFSGGFVAARFGIKRCLTTFYALESSALLAILLSPSPVLLILFSLIYSSAGSVMNAAWTSVVAQLTPSRLRGTGYSFYFMPFNITGPISPMIGTILVQNLGLEWIFIWSMTMFVITAALLQSIPMKKNQ